jgi:gluconolactonase
VAEAYRVFDDRFRPLASGDAMVGRIWSGCRWAEGPVYVPAGRYLVWSDVANDRMLRWDETTGSVGTFREPSGYANGNTLDGSGRLVTCEQGNRRVTRTEHDGSVTVIAERYRGMRLNSPNDVVVHSDGSVWFTDPSYGIDSDYEGYRAESEIGACNVYRVDPASGEVRLVADDFERPNGLAFSPDERRLYIADSRAGHIRLFEVGDDGALSGGEILASSTAGVFDGFRLDVDGRIWAGAGDGVHCIEPDGTLIGKILLPETVANVVFGGRRRTTLFICATTSVYSLMLPVRGAPLPLDHASRAAGDSATDVASSRTEGKREGPAESAGPL